MGVTRSRAPGGSTCSSCDNWQAISCIGRKLYKYGEQDSSRPAAHYCAPIMNSLINESRIGRINISIIRSQDYNCCFPNPVSGLEPQRPLSPAPRRRSCSARPVSPSCAHSLPSTLGRSCFARIPVSQLWVREGTGAAACACEARTAPRRQSSRWQPSWGGETPPRAASTGS